MAECRPETAPEIEIFVCGAVFKVKIDLREDETISVDPGRILWVEGHELIEENVRNRSHTHGRTWVAGVRLRRGIDLDKGVSNCSTVIVVGMRPS